MDFIFEFILELVDNLTGNKLDYGIGRLASRLTRNVKNEKVRRVLHLLIWALVFISILAALITVFFVIEAWRTGKI